MIIAKENNFVQAGARWRSFDAARQDRFIKRVTGMLADPRYALRCFWHASACGQCVAGLVLAGALTESVCVCVCGCVSQVHTGDPSHLGWLLDPG